MSDASTELPAVQRHCIGCGYDLRNLPTNRCPECGLEFSEIASSLIPWEYRKSIGRWRAFWRTVKLASLQPKKLVAQNGVAIDVSASLKFRWIVWAAAAIPALGWFIAILVTILRTSSTPGFAEQTLYLGDPTTDTTWQWQAMWFAGATIPPVMPLGILLAFYFWTAAPSLFLRSPRGSANYLCAPLVFLFIPLSALGAMNALDAWGVNSIYIIDSLAGITILGYVLVLLIFWNTERALIATRKVNLIKLIGTGFVHPAIWVAAGFVAFAVFPGICGLLRLMDDSLR